jgi:predicted AAA+ superfamily ATPase
MRYLTPFIQKDLEKKMVFLGGPRQCGKTTLAEWLLKQEVGRYFNWDADEDRRALLRKEWADTDRLLVFDELHKYSRWKNWIKGVFDTQRRAHKFLVTGSARMDVYKKGGDSLFGRYHHWRLHPFSLCELPPGMSKEEGFSRLLKFGGFPESFLTADENEAKRWRRARYDLVIKQDVRDLEAVVDIGRLSLFVDLLRERVGQPIVLSNLARDLEIAPKTAKHWLEILERMYLIFVVRPYSGKLARTLTKPPKVYFFDNGDVIGNIGHSFENFVATHLLKQIQFLEDRTGDRYELRYIRDKEKREVDFLILCNKKPLKLIEARWDAPVIESSFRYYAQRVKAPEVVLLLGSKIKPFDKDGISVRAAADYLGNFKYV